MSDLSRPRVHEPSWPEAIHSLEQVAAVEALAERAQTPCGEAAMVWRMWGPPHGRPVLLLHGGSGSWNHWVRNIRALALAGRRVLVPDLPGFGDSAAPARGGDADVLPPILERGARELLGDTAVDVVGFSFGGLCAGLWAAGYPARIEHLVFSGAPSLCSEPPPPLDLRAWASTPQGPARDAIHRHNLMQLMLARVGSADELAIALHGANLARDRMRGRRISRTDILRRLLPAYDCQLSGLYGADDVLYRHRRKALAEALALAPKFHSLTWIKGAGHWAGFEAHESFDEALLRILG